MAKLFHVDARWDPEAKIWVSSSDVPGLEIATLSEFEALIRELVPEMLADRGEDGPVSVEWKASGTFELAAA